MSTMSAWSLNVSVSVPPNTRTLRAMLPCFCCLHAARARGLLPSAFCRKSDYHARTTRPAVLRARRRYRSMQYASTSGRRRIRSESGGARAPWRDRTTIWSMWWCIGPCEDACGRFNGRVCTCSGDPQTLVPLSPTHGLGACTWRQCKKLKVTSVFDICRSGDAVVSGPRETGLCLLCTSGLSPSQESRRVFDTRGLKMALPCRKGGFRVERA